MKKQIKFIQAFSIIVIFGVVLFFILRSNVKNTNEQQSDLPRVVNNQKDYGQVGMDLLKNDSLGFIKYGTSDIEVIKNLSLMPLYLFWSSSGNLGALEDFFLKT